MFTKPENNNQNFAASKRKLNPVLKIIIGLGIAIFVLAIIGMLIESTMPPKPKTVINDRSDTKTEETEGATEEKNSQTPESKNASPISIGKTFATKKIELTINKIEFSYDVMPDHKTGFGGTHYKSEPGEVYVHIDTDVKNLQKQALDCERILTAKVLYNDGYTYRGFATPEDKNLGFGYAALTDIEPLTTCGVHFLVKCPEEVESSSNPVNVVLEIEGQNYEYKMR